MAYVKKGVDKKLVEKLYNDFKSKYGKQIGDGNLYFIENYIDEAFKSDVVPFILTEFLSAHNLSNLDSDIYDNMERIIYDYVGNLDNKKVLEVGCGFIPVLGRKLAKNKSTKVTAYDPYVLKNYYKTNNLLTIKKDYKCGIENEKQDLFVGLMPCKGTMEMIDGTFRNNADMVLSLCGCSHFNPNSVPYEMWGSPILPELWRDNVIKYVDELAIKNKYTDFSIDKESMPYYVLKLKK